jgi:peptidoglycan/xylan/chitin deacetylase (PgdA/CDA1 family)
MAKGNQIDQAVVRRTLWSRTKGYYRRNAATCVFRKPVVVRPRRPLISFTFDDFPHSALDIGGAILNRFGVAGTYYVSLSLQGRQEPSGSMFVREDLAAVFEGGHELGCHTFSHCHSWETSPADFENSVVKNRTELCRLFPRAEFQTFSYPICPPRPLTKARVSRHFSCCRVGGQKSNRGPTDLNQVAAFFLEKSRDNIAIVKQEIDRNAEVPGWLVFATHDISEHPSPYGCTPGFFEQVVEYALASGSRILPVVKAIAALGDQSLG